jgi:hypothetical protein
MLKNDIREDAFANIPWIRLCNAILPIGLLRNWALAFRLGNLAGEKLFHLCQKWRKLIF